MRIVRVILVLVVLAAATGAAAVWWEARNFAAPGPLEAETVVVVKPGTGLATAARQLENAGVVSSGWLFRLGTIRRGLAASLKAGEYAFQPRDSMAAVLDRLVLGQVVQHRITLAEGVTSAMATALVNADPLLEGPPAAEPPEGSLLPETYLFVRGTTREEMVGRMRKAQSDLIAAHWPSRKAGLPYATEDEALILASIVEKETAIAAERPRIAAVFVNRLRRGMRLESDPTIIYGLTKGVPLGRGLRQSELARPNPYSTYQIDGLPPTPICNPGRDAILAVLDPPETNELFFVADGTGGHIFAATMAEHGRNVARWRRIERDQNGTP